MTPILARTYRGDLVESIHRGDFVVTDSQGKVVFSQGDVDKVVFWRSAAKPIQAVPVVTTGAASYYGFTEAELALMCASHSGENFHVQTARTILSKIGLDQTYLRCGVHLPVNMEARRRLLESREQPNRLHNNCSGKHGGMLALCQFLRWPLDSYLEPTHPLQELIGHTVAAFSGWPKEETALGIDGCGVPVFALPLRQMATAWARLACGSGLATDSKQAAGVIANAMRAYPQMVAGTGRFCTDLMIGMGSEQLVAKAGAEAVYCVGLPKHGWGMAVKVEDGSARPIPGIVLAILNQLGYDTGQRSELVPYQPQRIYNHHNQLVGKIIPEMNDPAKGLAPNHV